MHTGFPELWELYQANKPEITFCNQQTLKIKAKHKFKTFNSSCLDVVHTMNKSIKSI